MTTPNTPTTTDKPLNQSQVRNLTKLVENDYEQAFRDLEVQYKEILRQRLEEIDAEYALRAQEIQGVETEVREFTADLRARWAAKKDELTERGYGPKINPNYGGSGEPTISVPTYWEVSGHALERKKITDEMNRAYAAARHALQTAMAAAERQILLASITSTAAQDVLAGIPKAGDLMRGNLADPAALEDVKFTESDAHAIQYANRGQHVSVEVTG